jgi:hypothetical protein
VGAEDLEARDIEFEFEFEFEFDGRGGRALRGGMILMHSATIALPFLLLLAWIPVLDPAPAQGQGWNVREIIGTETGSGTGVFGHVRTAQWLSGGSIAVLDSRMYRIGLFDADGRFLAGAGMEGHGPGALAQPEDMLVQPDGSILVLDAGRLGISRWALSSDSTLGEVGFIPTKLWGDSFCRVGDRLFVHALQVERTIHEIDADGNVVNSFGAAYHPDNPALFAGRMTFIVGHIACVPDPARVVAVADSRPVVTAFTVKGDTAWTVDLPNFNAMQATIRSNGTVVYSGKGGWQNYVASVVPLPGGLVAVQVGVGGPGGLDLDRGTFRTFIYRAADGRLVDRREDLPVLAQVRAGRALAVRELPFPAVMVGKVGGP